MAALWSWSPLGDRTLLIDLLRTLNTELRNLARQMVVLWPGTNSLTDGAGTPSVYGATVWRVSNSGATNITKLTGKPGMTVVLWATNGNTTLVHGAGVLELKGGANVVMGATETRVFATVDGIYWREV